jgi:hypothetical protein
MSQANIELPQRRPLGSTSRTGAWWLSPLLVFLGLGAFIIYGTWAAFQGNHYFVHLGGADYLSPFYSPVIFDAPNTISGHSWFGAAPTWWPSIFPSFSPAFLILWAPGGFRFTCYYYRGAYYKAFWGDPPACAVGEPGFRGTKYRGEKKLPLVFQNIHRYFLYIAILFIFILGYDAWRAMWFTTDHGGALLPDGQKQFGIAVGTLVLLLNPILLGGYTLGCHSLRHIVGGRLNILSRRPARRVAYDCVSCLNRRHMLWAWSSLIWVGWADVYVRLVSTGTITDIRII